MLPKPILGSRRALNLAWGNTLAVLKQIGPRIDKIYPLTSKGVHADIMEYEVKQGVTHTYLILSDILVYRKTASTV